MSDARHLTMTRFREIQGGPLAEEFGIWVDKNMHIIKDAFELELVSAEGVLNDPTITSAIPQAPTVVDVEWHWIAKFYVRDPQNPKRFLTTEREDGGLEVSWEERPITTTPGNLAWLTEVT